MVDKSLARMIVSVLVPLLVLAGCSQEDVSGPDVQFSHQSPPALNHAMLCKTGPDGTFDIVGGVIATVTLSDGQCAQIATHPGDRSTVTVTVTEQPLGPGAALSQVVIEEFLGAAFIPVGPVIAPGPTVSIDLTDDHSFTVTYENIMVPTGGEGCTPGYWKQSHHFDSWTAPLDPTSMFTDPGFTSPGSDARVKRGRNENDVASQLDALEANQGGLAALTRHAMAALLNAASSGVSYAFTQAEVIQMYNDALSGALDVETTKDLFDAANNGPDGCPLN